MIDLSDHAELLRSLRLKAVENRRRAAIVGNLDEVVHHQRLVHDLDEAIEEEIAFAKATRKLNEIRDLGLRVGSSPVLDDSFPIPD